MSSEQIVSEARFAYIDSSAFTKLVLDEPESDDLRSYLAQSTVTLVSSALLRVETSRAIRQVVVAREALDDLEAALDAITLVAVSEGILRRSAAVEPAGLRSLDALHLATSLEVGAREMIVYDRRLAAAARAGGIAVTSPGA